MDQITIQPYKESTIVCQKIIILVLVMFLTLCTEVFVPWPPSWYSTGLNFF